MATPRNKAVSVTVSEDFFHVTVKVDGFMPDLLDVRALSALVQRQALALGISDTIRDAAAGLAKEPAKAHMAIQRRLRTLRAGQWKADDVSGNWADFVAALVLVNAAEGRTVTLEKVDDVLGKMPVEKIKALRARADVDKEMKRMVAERAAEAARTVDPTTQAALDAFA